MMLTTASTATRSKAARDAGVISQAGDYMHDFFRRFTKTVFNILAQFAAIEVSGLATFLITILIWSLNLALIIEITLTVILWLFYIVISYKIIKKSPFENK